MTFRDKGSVTVVIMIVGLAALIPVAAGTYAGDKPLVTCYSGEMKGGYYFSTGNSSYSGTLKPGEIYSVELPVIIPEDAVVEYVRVYAYWTWSRQDQSAVYPEVAAEVLPQTSGPPIIRNRYYDNKGFAGRNDYYTGMDSYVISLPPTGNLTFSLKNAAADNRTIIYQGVALLAVYTSPTGEDTSIWVDEGGDLLYANFGITPRMATGRADFPGEIRIKDLSSARLLLVAPSGGYSQLGLPDINKVYINRGSQDSLPKPFQAFLHIMFPRYGGKAWSDLFVADTIHQVGIESREVGPYLLPAGNRVEVEDNGDYLVFTNAVLSITYTRKADGQDHAAPMEGGKK